MPRIAAIEDRLAAPRGSPAPGAGVRVVLGDDETLLREGLMRLLTEAGFEVVVVRVNGGVANVKRRGSWRTSMNCR
jgi:hypothetical protein